MVYANFGKRLLAFLIDGAILWFGGFMLYFIIGYYGYTVSWLGGWLYFALMESSEKQATLGKMALGLTVTDLSGQRITFGRATGRYFGKFVSSMILCIGYLMAAFTERCQALHDMMAGTLVLDAKPASSYAAYHPQPAPQQAYAGAAPSAQFARPTVYGLTGEYSGRSIPVDDRGITMGRDSAYCQVSFSGNSQGISRRHCTVSFNRMTGTFLLTDVGSTYGTFLESGMKVIQGQAVTLRPGERFYLADRNNMFEFRV